MENTVLSALERFGLLEESKNITVALSGGADSMSLLYVLTALRERLDITISAAHLNHMIRGGEALRDEEFVKRQCESLKIPLFCERADVPAYAVAHKMSLEAAAREVRYDFLARVNRGAVATAHTASDNLETMLFNLTRGTALKGLCGIPPKRGVFIRPLILCTREEVERYCAQNGIPYVTDSTNLSDDYARNKIRHNVIPVLKQLNPAAEQAAVRTAAGLFEDERLLDTLADRFLSEQMQNGALCVTSLPDAAVAGRALKKFAEKTVSGLTLDNRHIAALYRLCTTGGRTSLPKNCTAEVRGDRLTIAENGALNGVPKHYSVTYEYRVNDLFKNGEKIHNLFLKNSLDCDKIIGKSRLRTRLPGDKIRLAGRNGTKTLKKLMNELAVPTEERGSIPVLADEAGVIWIYGIGVAARCAVTKKTEKMMIINAFETQNKTN